MSRKRNDVLNSPYPVSRPERTPESYEDFLDSLQSLFNGGDAEAFFDAIDEAPARWQRKPELMLSKAVGFLRSGDDEGAKKVLAEIERTHPKFAPLYFYKAGLYIQDMCPAHALRMINRVRSVGMLDDEAEQGMNEIGQVARQLISETADELGVSYEKMEKASWFHEAAQEKLSSGQWQVAEQNAREAARLIPNWTSPRNNRSYALYYLGRMNEALTEANAVLAQQPDNLHALKNLAVFHAGLGEDDKARGYSARMALHLQSLPPDSDEVNIIISVLGLVNDDDTLWTLAQKYLKRDDEDLLEGSWHTLGVAAIHSGHLREAQKLLEKIEQYYEPAKSLAVEVRKALKTSGRIPSTSVYSIIGLLLPKTVIEELIEMLGRYLNDERLPQHIQKKMEDYIQKRPFVVNGLLRMMADPEAAEIIPSLLLSFNQPDVDARLLGFALGNLGTSQQRLQVLSKMAQEGREVPPSPIRFWNEEIGEWMDVDFTAQMLSDDVDLNISPKAAIWAEKAQTAQDDEEKIDLWRKAVEVDPKSGYAVHMLGVMLIKNGQKEEGEKLARRAIEVDPDYMFAYANLALMEVQKDDRDNELAEKYLDKVMKAPFITTQTAFIMHFALMLLAVQRMDFESARKEFEIAVELRPDDPILEGWDSRFRLSELVSGTGGWLAEWQAKSRLRSHNKEIRTPLEFDTNSDVTLNSLTRDALGTVARVWGLTSYGRKAELIRSIVERMEDARIAKEVISNLTEIEKAALRWVLDNNAVRSWKEFTQEYGDDSEESPHWNYHDPQTVIGRLRQTGLLAKGTLKDKQVVFIPADARKLLKISL